MIAQRNLSFKPKTGESKRSNTTKIVAFQPKYHRIEMPISKPIWQGNVTHFHGVRLEPEGHDLGKAQSHVQTA
jgi:hypothetical protein